MPKLRRLFSRRKGDIEGAPDDPPGPSVASSGSGSTPTPTPSRAFPSGIKLLHCPSDCTIDVVFVHGLTGDREKTWTARDTSEPWPKTLLPSRLPTARILTFGYDARVADWKRMVSQTRIANHAGNLLSSLAAYRDNDATSQRPILFVCHSLGGLVCEDALVTAKQRPDTHLRDILRSTRGIVFLGTPHHGAGLAQWAEMLAKHLGMVKQTNRDIVDVLKRDSEVLARIQDSFHTMLRAHIEEELPRIKITCFYEELPVVGVGLIVPQDSAILPGYIPIGIYANHMEMTKYATADDAGFVAVSAELRRWVKEIAAAEAHRREGGHSEPKHLEKERTDSSGGLLGGLTLESQRRHFVVPLGRNKAFVGRDSIMEQLLERIPPKSDPDACQWTAIEGLGGIGKTQIALEAAFRVRDLDAECSVFWVPAVTRMTFENAYREIGLALGVSGIQEEKADVIALVKSSLSRANAGRWLLIVDNADDTELVFGDTGQPPLLQCLPSSYRGSILFTTRNHEVAAQLDIQPTDIFPVGNLSMAEAKRMLYNGLEQSQLSDVGSTERLLDFLTFLPLAIKQASAYMMRNRFTTTKYLGYCTSSGKVQAKLLSEDFGDRYRYAEIANPVAATWIISFTHIRENYPRSAEYLQLICYFAEKDIPVSLLPGEDEIERDEAIAVLKSYAFIIERKASDSFDIHRLVRLAMRNWIKKQEVQRDLITTLLKSLASAFPYPKHENKDIWLRYLPHTQAVLKVHSECSDQDAQWRLLFNVAQCYLILGKYLEAERLYRPALELTEKVLGREHSDTLASMNNLAEVLRQQGKYEGAEELNRQTLGLSQKVLGREHPDTLGSMNNLANVLRHQGKYGETEEMRRQILELSEKVLGREHLKTLTSMNNLAEVLGQQGKYGEAEQMHRQALRLREKVLGREHPNTLTSMNNLAELLRQQGNYVEVEQMHRQALGLREKVLGREHPDTLGSMNNLANVFRHQGKYEKAKEMHQQTLDLITTVLGQEHPYTLTSMNNLAEVLGQQGKYGEAEQMHRQALGLREKVLGREHPETRKSRTNLQATIEAQANEPLASNT